MYKDSSGKYHYAFVKYAFVKNAFVKYIKVFLKKKTEKVTTSGSTLRYKTFFVFYGLISIHPGV